MTRRATYDSLNRLQTVTYPNGVQTDYQRYDPMNRIMQMATQTSGYIYQRGLTGNLTNATELNGRQVTWSFDGIYRLTGETQNSAIPIRRSFRHLSRSRAHE